MFCAFIVRDFWTLMNAENADFFLISAISVYQRPELVYVLF